MVDVIRQGIPTSLFMSIKEMTPFSDQEWSDFLDISLKSLQRYKKESGYVFRSIHSEKIIELMEVTAVGLEVFDTAEDFVSWLNASSHALGNRRPIELLRDSTVKNWCSVSFRGSIRGCLSDAGFSADAGKVRNRIIRKGCCPFRQPLEFQRNRADLLCGQSGFGHGRGCGSPSLIHFAP